MILTLKQSGGAQPSQLWKHSELQIPSVILRRRFDSIIQRCSFCPSLYLYQVMNVDVWIAILETLFFQLCSIILLQLLIKVSDNLDVPFTELCDFHSEQIRGRKLVEPRFQSVFSLLLHSVDLVDVLLVNLDDLIEEVIFVI